MSGIDVSDEAMGVYNIMKQTTAKKQQQRSDVPKMKYKLLVLEIDGSNKIHVNYDSSKEKCSNDKCRAFLGEHPQDPYFLVYEFDVPDKSSSKLVGIAWIPDNLPISKRIKYASTFEGIKNKFAAVKWCGTKQELCDCDDKEIMSYL